MLEQESGGITITGRIPVKLDMALSAMVGWNDGVFSEVGLDDLGGFSTPYEPMK